MLVTPVDHSKTVRALEEEVEQCRELIKESPACGINVLGASDEACAEGLCDNSTWNELDGEYCPVLKIRDLKVKKQSFEIADQMLDFYWSTKSETDCMKYLRRSGLVYSYR